jgi:hypothetical protein
MPFFNSHRSSILEVVSIRKSRITREEETCKKKRKKRESRERFKNKRLSNPTHIFPKKEK